VIKYVVIILIGIGFFGLIIGGVHSWVKAERAAAVETERRERMADAIELIRTTDKALDVARKATDEDLCRELGGKTVEGVCQ